MTQVIEETQSTALPPTPPPHDINARTNYGKPFNKLPLSEQLLIAGRVLDNTIGNPQISNVMLRFGYDEQKMADFRVLYDQAIVAHNAQVKEYGEKSEAYADFNKIYAVAKYEFSTLRKLLRVALKTDKEKLNQLNVFEAKKQTVGGLLDQMQVCYKNVFGDRDVLDKLAKIGINSFTLQGYLDNYNAARLSYSVFFREDSEAVHATRIRDDKVEALCDFLSDFFALARIAFADQPELLKQIT